MAVNKCHRPESGICTSVGGWSPSFTRGREGGSLPGCGGIKGSEHGLPSYLSLACSRPSFHQPGRHEDMDPASVAQLLIQPSSTVQTCRVPVSSKSSSGSACVVCMPEIMPVGGRGGGGGGEGGGGRKGWSTWCAGIETAELQFDQRIVARGKGALQQAVIHCIPALTAFSTHPQSTASCTAPACRPT